MAQIKAHEADGWLARRQAGSPVVLVYGPDRGLVSERARRFAEKADVALDDPFSVVRLDAAEIERDPGRLLDEANTMPMFAGRRLLWLKNAQGQKALADALKQICQAMPPDTLILIEAGDLKKGAPLRTVVEASPAAMAIPCYADDGRSIDSVIDDVVGRSGLSIGADARALLRRSLGGDRLATRAELDKLVLYKAGAASIDVEDIRALSGDVSGLSADDVVDAALAGDLASFDRQFARLAENPSSLYSVLSGMQRQLQALHAMRGVIQQSGTTPASIVAAARPPVFFARRRLVEQCLGRWDTAALEIMLARVYDAILTTRRNPAISAALAHRALLAITVDAARSRRTTG
ncbi:MAG: DNA polymerase III subunit delta [Rhizobiaceae bacterium]|nr:DNA polymerase III subunit delta [Rhizobiaceae bacterium]